ncbi:cytochrome b/b6 domain-containing protein [Thalassospira sp. MCCC 1A01428]|uniref:cytochrome b/b6 domain-containing protein n=1 Tax=Thalassospira sp. MCCC 1A01428 TaxID=1470575 RepID=UPI000A1DABC3|nr:cytochrome b/b6 domain-containing protein [Thalassospira sp. MCCC 1A01428]OSQ45168.1 cytochrome B561 [Thalassospira sp. MCCC 1A01428]
MAATVKVWDPLVRIFHWSLVTCFAVAWLSADVIKNLHEWAGYTAAALIGFRLFWGLFGPHYARFSQFVRGPKTTLDYLRAIPGGKAERYLGHNPAGAAMIIALLACMALVATTGWMQTTDAYWGVRWVQNVHEFLANCLLTLVIGHLAGVIIASYHHRENLVRAMVTGRKRIGHQNDIR